MNQFLLFWSVAVFIFLLIELGHPGLFFFLSFALGALAALVVSFWFALPIQGLLFFGISFISFLLLSAIARKKSSSLHPTNVQALIGKRAIVIKEIQENNAGQVFIDGQYWSARAAHGSIAQGSTVVITAVKGCHLIVKT